VARENVAEGTGMLFMVIEHFRPGQAPAIYRRFREKGRMAPEALRYLHTGSTP